MKQGDTRTDDAMLAELVRQHFPDGLKEFKPCAFYHRGLDTIEVFTEDCSVTEVMIGRSNILHLKERNYDYDKDGELILCPQVTHVGFSIGGAKQFSKIYGLPCEGKVKISDILKKLSEIHKDTIPAILDVALPLLAEYNLDEVELSSP